MAGDDTGALMSALTTEHFTLQTARAITASDTAGRSALYVGSVSGALIALGFIGQVSELGRVFFIFALAVLPAIFVVGLITYDRALQNALEDVVLGWRIHRIRGFYATVHEGAGEFFDPAVTLNYALRPMPWQLLTTTATTIAVVNSVLLGVTSGLLVHELGVGVSTGVATVGAIVVSCASAVAHVWHEARSFRSLERQLAQLGESPPDVVREPSAGEVR